MGAVITLDQIVEEARQLPADVVAELVDRIMLARHGGMESGLERAWKGEIHRRIAEIDQGKVKGIPVEESLARIGKTIKK
jgi:putative addiction module component (TIGR02574 family)